MSFSSFKKQSGFTLVELLIVVGIIGLLTTGAVAGMNNARRMARDTSRKQDMNTFRKALEMYYNDHGSYPISGDLSRKSSSHDSESWGVLASDLADYLDHIPVDPKQGNNFPYYADTYGYMYQSKEVSCIEDGQWYAFVYRVETGSPELPRRFHICDTSYYSAGSNYELVVMGNKK